MCSRDPNQAAFPPFFLPSGPGRWNGTYQSTPINVRATTLVASLPFSVFLGGRHRPPNSSGHRCPRPGGSSPHDLHRVSPLQRGFEYSKAIALHGRTILLWTVPNNVFPVYKPTGESPTPCNMASEKSSSRAIWGKDSPTKPFLAGLKTPPSWLHPGLQNVLNWSWH